MAGHERNWVTPACSNLPCLPQPPQPRPPASRQESRNQTTQSCLDSSQTSPAHLLHGLADGLGVLLLLVQVPPASAGPDRARTPSHIGTRRLNTCHCMAARVPLQVSQRGGVATARATHPTFLASTTVTTPSSLTRLTCGACQKKAARHVSYTGVCRASCTQQRPSRKAALPHQVGIRVEGGDDGGRVGHAWRCGEAERIEYMGERPPGML